ncbi:hypothetical protein JCM3774_001453 [Rhodotorula dairenensis]
MGVAHHPALHDLLPLAEFEPLRVASHTDMTAAVHFSLEKLASTPNRPLVLHTLPPPPTATTSSSSPAPSTSAVPISQKQVETAVEALPKLVSVLEIIKREFPSCSGPSNGAKSPHPLHQYTRLTTFETALDYQRPPPAELQAEIQDLEAVRQELVQLEWLSGRAGRAKRPRKRHSPCMVVVLSRTPLPVLAKSPHYTYQQPIPLSKKRPRPTEDPAQTTIEALPLTSTPLSGKDTSSRGQVPLPDPSQAGAITTEAQSGRNPNARTDDAMAAVEVERPQGPVEEQEKKKKKKNRRRLRRKAAPGGNDAAAPAGGDAVQGAETSEQRMDISA